METYHFLNELDVSYLHVFTYSERANTAALQIKEIVPSKVRNERSKMLHILSEKKRRLFYEQNIGKIATVLFENDVEEGKMHGFTENYVRVSAKYDPLLINELKTIQLTEINEKGTVDIQEIEFATL